MGDERESAVVHQNEVAEPIWKIITVASIAAGVQFGWALQLSLLTPYVQTLGVPHAYATFVWLCGPLSGLIVQPLVGYFSDNLKAKFGRRRPFIIGGSIFVALAIFMIGFAKDLGHNAGDSLEQATKPRAVAIFVVGFSILDVANNMLQGPTRAFLADLSNNDYRRINLSNAYFSFFMAVGNVGGYAAGSYSNLYKLFPFTKTEACNATCANLKSCFLIDIVLLTTVVVVACVLVKEKQHNGHDDDDSKDSSSSSISGQTSFFIQIASSFKTMKKPMWILLLVTCINWIAWFPFLLFDTDWMGREVYGGQPEGAGTTALQNTLYDKGVRGGSLGLMINAVVLGFTSLAVDPLSQMIGGNNLWGIVNIILAVGLGGTVWVSKVAAHWREVNALQMPPSNVVGGALSIFALLGIPQAITFSLPFSLASIYCSAAGGGQGLSLGVVNLSIVIPQMIISMSSGPLDKAFGGGNLPAFIMGAIAAILSSLMAFFILPKPPKRVSKQPLAIAGGGH